jgi:Zn-dependent peptidase ImmA (M78 family)
MTSVSSYKSPATLLEELGITEPLDIEIEAIAEYCNATIVYEPLKGCEARILGHGDRAIITVNSTSLRERQRFSGAHELGHWMRDRGKIAFACAEMVFATEWGEENPEVRANRYAADLLLPPSMFSRRAKNREMTFATVRDLAKDFQTSLTATAIRLVELGSLPAMLVCYELGKRRWFTRGPDVPQIFWPRNEPERDTVAYALIHGTATKERPIDVYADGWFDLRNADRYEVREDSVRISDRFVLSLLWWKDESQILDLG